MLVGLLCGKRSRIDWAPFSKLQQEPSGGGIRGSREPKCHASSGSQERRVGVEFVLRLMLIEFADGPAIALVGLDGNGI
jgi:hypothetical protein